MSCASGSGLSGTRAETAQQAIVGEALAPEMVEYELELRREGDARDGFVSLGRGYPARSVRRSIFMRASDRVPRAVPYPPPVYLGVRWILSRR